jgi:hypothetical protein
MEVEVEVEGYSLHYTFLLLSPLRASGELSHSYLACASLARDGGTVRIILAALRLKHERVI